MSQERFERQLALIRTRHSVLAERIAATDRSAVEEVVGPGGFRTLRQEGLQLASLYDPRSEAERLVASVQEGTDVAVLVGFGLGYAVDALLERGVSEVVVYEPDPARLRAALELREDLDWLAESRVQWADTPEETAERFSAVYAAGLTSKACVWPPLMLLDAAETTETLRRVARVKQARDADTVTNLKMGIAWAHLTAVNAPHLAMTPRFSALHGVFQGKPAVVVAAGPSLERQLPLLKKHAERLVIIAIGQTLPALRKAGIEPDLVHVLESQNVSHQLTLAGDLGSVSLVLAPSSHPSLFELSVGARFMTYPASNPLGWWIGAALGEQRPVGGGSTVAQSAVRLASALGCDRVALVGQDLAFTDGRVYAANTAYDMLSLETRNGQLTYTGVREKSELFGAGGDASTVDRAVDPVWVEGWHGERVATSRHYAMFIEWYRALGDELEREGIRLVNCTEGGARIHGLAHMRFADFLRGCPRDPIDAAGRIQRAAREASLGGPDFVGRLGARARRKLAQLDHLTRKGLSRAKAARRKTTPAACGTAAAAALRSVASVERALQDAIASLPWIDVFVQSEAYALGLQQHRTEAATGAPIEALEEARVLFETTRKALTRASAIVDRLDRPVTKHRALVTPEEATHVR